MTSLIHKICVTGRVDIETMANTNNNKITVSLLPPHTHRKMSSMLSHVRISDTFKLMNSLYYSEECNNWCTES